MTGRRTLNWPEDVPSCDADLSAAEWRELYLLAQEQLDFVCQRLNLPPGNIGFLAVEEYESIYARAYPEEDRDSAPNR